MIAAMKRRKHRGVNRMLKKAWEWLKRIVLTAGKWFLWFQLSQIILAVVVVGYFVIWDQEALLRFTSMGLPGS